MISITRAEEYFPQRRKGAKVFLWFSFAPLRLCGSTVLCSVIFLAGCNATDTANKNTPVISNPPNNTTYPMPPFKGTSIANMGWEFSDGNRSVFADYQGKVLVLDFYATWCAPCRNSIPHLIDLEKRYGPQGLVIVGLNVGGTDDQAEVPAFAREFNTSTTAARMVSGITYPAFSLSRPISSDIAFSIASPPLVRHLSPHSHSLLRNRVITLKSVSRDLH